MLAFVFIVGRVIGDPISIMLPVEATPEQADQLRESLGLAGPLHEQALNFASNVIRGDFGDSIWQRRPALGIVLERVPNTFFLAAVAIAMAMPASILLGSIAARRPKSLADKAINVLSLSAVSIVDFWLGLMLILFFAVRLGWFPTGGSTGAFAVVLPAATLAFRSLGRMAQFTRSAMLDEYAKPYVQMARAKGMPERRVFGITLKNAAVPILTLTGDETASLVNGSIVVETVFAWPGIGLLIVQAITQRDLFLLEAAAFVVVIIVVTVNALTDMTYSVVNPKIRLGSEGL